MEVYVDPATCWVEGDIVGEHAFSLLWQFVCSDEDLFGQARAVHVLVDSVQRVGSIVHAYGEWVGLTDLETEMALPEEAPAAPTLSEKPKLSQAAEPWMYHAALLDLLQEPRA